MNPHCLACGREIEESDIESNYCEYCDTGMIDDPHGEPEGPFGYEQDE